MDNYTLTCGQCGTTQDVQANPGDTFEWVCEICGNDNLTSFGAAGS